jgi:hypothetical protein
MQDFPTPPAPTTPLLATGLVGATPLEVATFLLATTPGVPTLLVATTSWLDCVQDDQTPLDRATFS